MRQAIALVITLALSSAATAQTQNKAGTFRTPRVDRETAPRFSDPAACEGGDCIAGSPKPRPTPRPGPAPSGPIPFGPTPSGPIGPFMPAPERILRLEDIRDRMAKPGQAKDISSETARGSARR